MIVTSTELQNNFGKYVALAHHEDIIVTRNGHAIALLSGIKRTAPSGTSGERRSNAEIIAESAAKYPDSLNKATYEEFLELSRNSDERYEYIDGQIYMLASPKTAHQYALSELLVLFHHWSRGRSCRPFVAPYDIELRKRANDINIVLPDLMIICDLEQHLNDEFPH